LKTRMIAILLALCSTGTAQIADYLGPGILTRGAGDIGTRSGQDVDLRYFVNATGVYDTGIQPFSVDGNGKLVNPGGLYGTEIGFGAYGVHKGRHSRLGIDYQGDYRHYPGVPFYDGTDQTLALGYTYQQSRRLILDMRQTAGMVSLGTPFGGILPTVTGSIVTPSSLLFDNRMEYLQSTVDANYLLSAHTTVTLGGDWFGIWRKATGLIGMQGYMLRGEIKHRITQRTSLGAAYIHTHFDFPKAYGQSDIDSLTAVFATQMGRSWILRLSGGAYLVEVQGLQQVAVSPEIAALLGVSMTQQTFYQKSIFPQWDGSLTRQFHRASLSFDYANGATPGNGVYLTSRQTTATANFSYTASRKWSLSASGGYARLEGIGQGLQPFSQVTGSAGASYSITRPIQAFVRYDARHQEIINGFYLQDSYRATIGLSFSPSDVPLSFH
jgi:hypothetical protein